MKNLPVQNLPPELALKGEVREYANLLHPTIDQNNNEIQIRLRELSNALEALDTRVTALEP